MCVALNKGRQRGTYDKIFQNHLHSFLTGNKIHRKIHLVQLSLDAT